MGGIADQSRAFLVFAREALSLTRGRSYEVVFATSSRLMTAALGAWIARRAKSRLYLDLRDIFVDTMRDVALGPIAQVLRPFFALVERWTVSRANKVNLVSPGFAGYFESRYPRQKFSYFTNGIDDEFMNAGPVGSKERSTVASLERPVTVLYAGNIGEGQGMDCVLPSLARRMEGRVRFRVIGDGGRKNELARALVAAGVSTVELLDPVARAELVSAYKEADVLFLHLNDYDAFRKVLPSKIFEYAAMGKPIWAGVAGYSAEFIASEVTNAAVFAPRDVSGAIRAFESLRLRDECRTQFIERHSRDRISREMAADMVATSQGI
jgi:glycosyltransferase involved in cell wall biosynthesis